jgi:hypothetical protein
MKKVKAKLQRYIPENVRKKQARDAKQLKELKERREKEKIIRKDMRA